MAERGRLLLGQLAEDGHRLRAPFTPAPAAARRSGVAASWRVPGLVLLLLMFWQFFQYMIDVPPLYALSKLWPLLTLPAAIWAVAVLRLPFATYYAVLLAYVVGVSPAISMLQLFNDLPEAAATTTKVWSFSFYFAFSAALAWLRPGMAQLRRAILSVAVLTGVAMWLLWLLVPAGAYKSDATLSQVFLLDNERGFRIVLPAGLAIVGLFYVARSFTRAPRVWHACTMAAAFLTMALIYKQRLAILSAALVTALILTRPLRARAPLLFYGGALLVLAAAAAGSLLLPDQLLQSSLGTSLSIRETTAGLAWSFIADSPVRLLFGVGATTSYSAITLADILHFHDFFAADIGWLGVGFEYGAVGAGLIAGAYGIAVLTLRRAAQGGDPLVGALSDWTLYQLLVTSVYSVTYTPGEIASATALGVYAMRQARRSA